MVFLVNSIKDPACTSNEENRYWKQNGIWYVLHFVDVFVEDEVILMFKQDDEEYGYYYYTSALLKENNTAYILFGIKTAKYIFEGMIEDFMINKMYYYKHLIERWEERSDV